MDPSLVKTQAEDAGQYHVHIGASMFASSIHWHDGGEEKVWIEDKVSPMRDFLIAFSRAERPGDSRESPQSFYLITYGCCSRAEGE